MPQLDHIILADGVSLRPDGKIDLFGAAWDTIFAPTVPIQHPQMTIVVRVLLTTHEAETGHRLNLVIMSPDGPEIARAQTDLDPVPAATLDVLPAGDLLGFGALLNFQGLVFPQYGRYHIAVLWDGNEMRDPMTLKVSPLPPSAPFPEGA